MGNPTLSKMLFNSGEFGCVQEMAIIVAMLQVENVFLMPPGQIAKAKVAKRKFEVAEGDLLTLLNVFNAFKSIEVSSAKHWCSSNFLRFKALVRAEQLFQRLSPQQQVPGSLQGQRTSCFHSAILM